MWECFLVEPAGRAVLGLRRFTFGTDKPCPGNGKFGHNAVNETFMTVQERVPTRGGNTKDDHWPSHHDLMPPHDDKRWPTVCTNCGYEFAADDEWQVTANHIYQKVDEPTEHWTMKELPIGAMFDAFWLPWTGSDGKSISVILPPGGIDHVWHIDMPVGEEGNRHPWTRIGEPPKLVVSPSILSPKYHGFLGSNGAPAGWLSDTLGDRPNPFA